MNSKFNLRSKIEPHSEKLVPGLSIRWRVAFAGTLLVGCLTAAAQSPPVITSQPRGLTNDPGTTATFTVEVAGDESLTYQWQQAYFGSYYFNRPEETNRTLVIARVQDTDTGTYRVIVSNGTGTVTSAAAPLYVLLPDDPSITLQPTNQTFSAGATVTVRARAVTINPPLTWQWQYRKSLSAVKADLPGRTKATLTLSNIGVAHAGYYSAVISSYVGAITRSDEVELIVDPTFIKVTTGDVVTDEANFWFGTWADWNGDGFSDLYVTAGVDVPGQAPALYRNDGGTNFVRMTTNDVGILVAPLRPRECGGQGLWGDFNNDGRMDILQCDYSEDYRWSSNRFFLGSEGNTFKYITNHIGINELPVGPESSSLIDYNNDGLLDIYITTGKPVSQTSDALYRNNGDGTFTKTWSPTESIFYSIFGSWGDYDNDGDMDLWVTGANEDFTGTAGRFYRNDGLGKFTWVTEGIPDSSGWGGVWGDLNNDGYLDFLNGWSLNMNQGDGTFVSMRPPAATWTLQVLGDYDNDGDLDIVVGYWQGECRVLRNDGDFNFTRVYFGSQGPTDEMPGTESIPTFCDYNNDGFLDLFVATRGNPKKANFLYRNGGREGGNTNHWIIIKPKGTISNRCAVGAKVRVLATIQGQETWQLRQISGWYLDDFRAHFGLGDATKITTLRIEWPSGTVQELTNVAVDQILNVTEPSLEPKRPVLGITVSHGQVSGQLTDEPNLAYDIQVSEDLKNWTQFATVTTDAAGAATWSDPIVTARGGRFYRALKK
jgi:enediyne biosynthesis protein E4